MGVIMHNNILYGGGSTIEPNPTGTPTEQLNTVKINNTIYEIVGGGGSGSVYSRTTLYDVGVALPAQVTLSDDITNYDTIEIVISYESINKGKTSFYYDAKRFTQDFPYVTSPDGIYTPHMVVSNYYPQYSRFIMGDANNKLWCYQSDHGYLIEVAGIKYENSGGAGYSKSTLYTDPITSVGEVTLSDDISNYDSLLFIIHGNANGASMPVYVDTEYILSCAYSTDANSDHVLFSMWGNEYIRMTLGTANNKLYFSQFNGDKITGIYGIKFGGNSNNNENGIFSKSVIQSQNILSEFEYRNAKIPSYAQNICIYPIAEHAIEEGFIPATDVLNDNTSLTIYAVVKSLVSDNNYHSLIACSYASSNGNAPNIYSYGGRLYTSIYGSDTSTNVSSTVYHVLSIAVDNSTKKVRYYIDGVAYHGEKSFNNSGRYPSFGGTLVSTTGLIDSTPCDLIYGAVVSGAESAEDIIANHNLLMIEYSEYIGH